MVVNFLLIIHPSLAKNLRSSFNSTASLSSCGVVLFKGCRKDTNNDGPLLTCIFPASNIAIYFKGTSSQKINKCPFWKKGLPFKKEARALLSLIPISSTSEPFCCFVLFPGEKKTKKQKNIPGSKKTTNKQIPGETKIPFTCDHLIAFKVAFLIPLRLPHDPTPRTVTVTFTVHRSLRRLAFYLSVARFLVWVFSCDVNPPKK